MGRWDDKFVRAQRKWDHWQMQEHALTDRVLHKILEDKARRHPDRVVFQFHDEGHALEQVHLNANRVANGLLALGVKPGDKVAAMLPNCIEFMALWFGLNRIGAAIIPINVALRGEGLRWQIAQSDSVAVVLDERYAEQLLPLSDELAQVNHIVLRRAAPVAGPVLPRWPRGGALTWEELTSHGENTPEREVAFNALSSISFTSGTTGRSKGVMFSHHYWYQIWRSAVQYARYTEDDVLYTGLPFFHAAAHGTTGPALLADAKAVVVDRFSASRMLEDCRRWECTSAKYLGSILAILMKQAPSPHDADNPLRLLVGSSAPTDVFQAFERRFNTQLLELYGMTECNACLVNPYDARRIGSCGQPITGYRVKVVDDNDMDVPAGKVGEIVVQPERKFLGTMGYYKDPDATLELFRNFWIHTGDLGRADADGYFYFVDRKKQALRRRGENISSFEVESVINSHPSVKESCVVGVPAEVGDEDVKAVVVLRDGVALPAQELVDWCEARMAYFAVPRYVAFRDHLPRTPTDRIEKYRLKAEGITADCWDREASRVHAAETTGR
ncbi:AMP-binding protein [Hydrogenophaga sp. BPS33]|uniref:AMP-binding protein n=1 Tax=Hydrogenophaga sp. BPS33 TaxID=2651974 RepID=UPI0013202683|nr:AMP-binding protein [Hydrogenophaga sp. BPS33]QHE84172.1 ATP-dependent acyl-CoA ligase [Hydrogenophaga sp. BPS33]